MMMVDSQNISVGEKMLRLQGRLTGKALTLVKDLGYSGAAYERAKSKLEKRYGGERRLQITHLTTLHNWPKVRSRNLQDLEQFQALLEEILVAMDDSAPGQEQSLKLSAKEKLSEYDIQTYKYWLMDHARDDSFGSLVDWVELCVQVMEEAREETEGISKKSEDRERKTRDGKRFRVFNTRATTRRCIFDDAFKKLPVQKRKELISKSGHCFRCLKARLHSKDCLRARECAVDGCQSDHHSSYLHEGTTQRTP